MRLCMIGRMLVQPLIIFPIFISLIPLALHKTHVVFRSLQWTCKECGVCMKDALLPILDGSSISTEQEEAKKLAAQITFRVGYLFLF